MLTPATAAAVANTPSAVSADAATASAATDGEKFLVERRERPLCALRSALHFFSSSSLRSALSMLDEPRASPQRELKNHTEQVRAENE
eukprot:CAMPEP_0119372080 /NCGR_PEP_ID=MMETSP1334-20130426/18128_1 /TAXON_ID=127549 /ORGANISM="Calcidiscus leptoporus, Strain RCC1130" /LENGTH=87 /DNA_ID=CAMNT_0007389475 /DNA_START=58 /DNA_END=322 /DNA_ORIENTATION=-